MFEIAYKGVLMSYNYGKFKYFQDFLRIRHMLVNNNLEYMSLK